MSEVEMALQGFPNWLSDAYAGYCIMAADSWIPFAIVIAQLVIFSIALFGIVYTINND